MALDEDLMRIMGFNQGPDNNAEVTMKIKPLGSVSASGITPANATATPTSAAPPEQGQPSVPSDPASVGGASTSVPGGTATPTLPATDASLTGAPAAAPAGYGPEGQSIVPEAQRVANKNPQLVTHPLGAQTDDIYESSIAQLQFDTQAKYMSLLQDLGFMDDKGQFMPGLLETEAVRRRSDIGFERDLALQQVVENAVRGNTVFSGRRAQNQAQTQRPYDAALSNLETTLGRELGGRYQQLGDLTRGFELNRNSMISEAAERIRQSLLGGPVGDSGGNDNTGDQGSVDYSSVDALLNSLPNLAEYPGALASYFGQSGGQAGAPARPKGMPSNWKWNAQKGYWVSPDGKNFLPRGKPWSYGSKTTTTTGSGGGGPSRVQ